MLLFVQINGVRPVQLEDTVIRMIQEAAQLRLNLMLQVLKKRVPLRQVPQIFFPHVRSPGVRNGRRPIGFRNSGSSLIDSFPSI